MVYSALLSFCFDKKTICFPTQEKLSKFASCSVAQVKRVLKKLEQYKLIKIINNGVKKTNTYEIVDIYNYGRMKDFETHIDEYIKNNGADAVPSVKDVCEKANVDVKDIPIAPVEESYCVTDDVLYIDGVPYTCEAGDD